MSDQAIFQSWQHAFKNMHDFSNRPSIAGAVLRTTLLLADKLGLSWPLLKKLCNAQLTKFVELGDRM